MQVDEERSQKSQIGQYIEVILEEIDFNQEGKLNQRLEKN